MGIGAIAGLSLLTSTVQKAARTLTGGNQAAAKPTPAAIQDELSISDEARAAEAKSSGLLGGTSLFPGVPRAADGSLRLEDIKTSFDQQRDALNDRIRQLFESAGIDTSQEIRLKAASDGSVVVSGDHPQKAEIEKLFRENPDLRNQFVGVAAMGEFQQAAQQSLEFQRAYAKDPKAAVAAFAQLFSNSHKPQFNLVVSGSEYSVDYR